jgi:hypothetical protein
MANHSPQMAKLLGTDTPEGAARFDRLAALRDSGYTGPVNQDGNRADMSDPQQAEAAGILDRMTDSDGYEAYCQRSDELDRRVAAGESITEILRNENVARMHLRLRDVYGINMDA